MSGSEVETLLQVIDQAFDRKSWHGTNLRGSLRGLTPRQAVWRPQPARHNIWEMVLHAAYWKYTVRRRLMGEKRGSFPLKGSDWFSAEETTDKAWRQAVKLLRDTHASLRTAIAALDSRQLPTILLLVTTLTSEQSIAEDPSPEEALGNSFVAALVSKDIVAYSQCWLSTRRMLAQMKLLGGPVMPAAKLREYHSRRNRDIAVSFARLQNLIDAADVDRKSIRLKACKPFTIQQLKGPKGGFTVFQGTGKLGHSAGAVDDPSRIA